MAYTTINKSTSFQNQLIWDGTGATNARTGGEKKEVLLQVIFYKIVFKG